MIYAKQVLNSNMKCQINYFKWYWLQLLKKKSFQFTYHQIKQCCF